MRRVCLESLGRLEQQDRKEIMVLLGFRAPQGVQDQMASKEILDLKVFLVFQDLKECLVHLVFLASLVHVVILEIKDLPDPQVMLQSLLS